MPRLRSGLFFWAGTGIKGLLNFAAYLLPRAVFAFRCDPSPVGLSCGARRGFSFRKYC